MGAIKFLPFCFRRLSVSQCGNTSLKAVDCRFVNGRVGMNNLLAGVVTCFQGRNGMTPLRASEPYPPPPSSCNEKRLVFILATTLRAANLYRVFTPKEEARSGLGQQGLGFRLAAPHKVRFLDKSALLQYSRCVNYFSPSNPHFYSTAGV
jgi:hypothetical protein